MISFLYYYIGDWLFEMQMKINHEKERTKDDFEQLMRENEKLHKHNEELIEKMVKFSA